MYIVASEGTHVVPFHVLSSNFQPLFPPLTLIFAGEPSDGEEDSDPEGVNMTPESSERRPSLILTSRLALLSAVDLTTCKVKEYR
jgi:hypothetical protein